VSGPLEGLRIVELASEHAAFRGKMLGDLGAEVIVVEPPGGHASRRLRTLRDDIEDPERSLWCGHTTHRSGASVLDLDTLAGGDQFAAS